MSCKRQGLRGCFTRDCDFIHPDDDRWVHAATNWRIYEKLDMRVPGQAVPTMANCIVRPPTPPKLREARANADPSFAARHRPLSSSEQSHDPRRSSTHSPRSPPSSASGSSGHHPPPPRLQLPSPEVGHPETGAKRKFEHISNGGTWHPDPTLASPHSPSQSQATKASFDGAKQLKEAVEAVVNLETFVKSRLPEIESSLAKGTERISPLEEQMVTCRAEIKEWQDTLKRALGEEGRVSREDVKERARLQGAIDERDAEIRRLSERMTKMEANHDQLIRMLAALLHNDEILVQSVNGLLACSKSKAETFSQNLLEHIREEFQPHILDKVLKQP